MAIFLSRERNLCLSFAHPEALLLVCNARIFLLCVALWTGSVWGGDEEKGVAFPLATPVYIG